MKSEVRNVEINNSYLYFIAVFNLIDNTVALTISLLITGEDSDDVLSLF